MFKVYYLLTSKSVMEKKKKKNQATLPQTFLNRVTPPKEEPQTGPSGSIAEEGIVITGDTGDDSSMQVICFEGLPVGQDVEVKDGDTDDPDLV